MRRGLARVLALMLVLALILLPVLVRCSCGVFLAILCSPFILTLAHAAVQTVQKRRQVLA
jgi:hypothetical protein